MAGDPQGRRVPLRGDEMLQESDGALHGSVSRLKAPSCML